MLLRPALDDLQRRHLVSLNICNIKEIQCQRPDNRRGDFGAKDDGGIFGEVVNEGFALQKIDLEC
jgi:hypothetical protein